MKYLVNRETKEHLLIDENVLGKHYEHWKIVEADSEGWIPCDGQSNPLPSYAKCEVVTFFDRLRIDRDSRESAKWAWGLPKHNEARIVAYRPILTEQSEPIRFSVKTESSGNIAEWVRGEDLFDRLRTAVEASSSIPALIAEINAMLPEGYEVAEKEKKVEPVEDMSDWRNWREGDVIECVDSHGAEGYLSFGQTYVFSNERDGDAVLKGMQPTWMIKRFRFNSRPTGSSK